MVFSDSVFFPYSFANSGSFLMPLTKLIHALSALRENPEMSQIDIEVARRGVPQLSSPF